MKGSYVLEEVVHGGTGGALEIGIHLGRRSVVRTVEDLPQHLDGALRVQAHLADLRLAPEGDDEEHLVVDLRNVEIERFALVEQQGELALVEDLGELLGGGEGTGRQRGQRQRLRMVLVGSRGDRLPRGADKRQEARPRDLLELAQKVVAAVELAVVDDESLTFCHARSSRVRPRSAKYIPASARVPSIVASRANHEVFRLRASSAFLLLCSDVGQEAATPARRLLEYHETLATMTSGTCTWA